MPFGEQFQIEIRKPESPWDSTANPDLWLKSTETALRKIESVKSGKILLQAVRDTDFWIRIGPLNHNVCNAHGAQVAKTIRGSRIFKGGVAFDAKVFEEGSHCFKSRLSAKYDRGGHADEVLFHELIHALRGGMGVNHDKTEVSGGLWRYSNTEEFFAVVISNIYISDVTNSGSSGLRAGHRGKAPLEKYFSHSLCFFASSPQVLPLMKKFKKDHEKLFANLAKVKAPFNPIKMMVDDPRAVENISRAKATLDNEKTAEKHQRWVEDKRLAEVRKAIANQKIQDARDAEAAINAFLNASPQQMADQLGRLGDYARKILENW